MVSTDQYRYIETYQGKYCEVEIYVNDNVDKKEFKEKVRNYLEKLYLTNEKE